jgi:hypothetical protein
MKSLANVDSLKTMRRWCSRDSREKLEHKSWTATLVSCRVVECPGGRALCK